MTRQQRRLERIVKLNIALNKYVTAGMDKSHNYFCLAWQDNPKYKAKIDAHTGEVLSCCFWADEAFRDTPTKTELDRIDRRLRYLLTGK